VDQLTQRIKKVAPDAIIAAGAAALIYGCWTVWPPLGWLALGAALIRAGLMLAALEQRPDKESAS